MPLITRRRFLQGAAAAVTAGAALAGYGLGWEPLRAPRVTRYKLTPPNWPAGLRLKIAALADLHVNEPYMTLARVAGICAQTNALGADMIVLLGDYDSRRKFWSGPVAPETWAPVLSALRAPLGVHAVLGNHDWWHDDVAQASGKGPVVRRRELERAGIPVYENECVRLTKDGHAFWLAGLGDQWAIREGRGRYRGVDDLPGTLAKVADNAPIILLAHEPDIFTRVPARVSLTLSGHTHGGQVRLFGYSPLVPSHYGNRFAYGHVVEDGRHLVVSGGLGCSILPIRFGSPPEIVLLELGGATT